MGLQRHAELAFSLQSLFTALTSNTPKASQDEVAQLKKTICDGTALEAGLRRYFEEKGLYPLTRFTTGSSPITMVFLLDIEGTTTPLPFVKKVLFPFARARIASFVEGKYPGEEAMREYVKEVSLLSPALKEAFEKDLASGFSEPVFTREVRDIVVKYLVDLMDRNDKSTFLKNAQGQIWKKAYEEGVIKGDVFNDAVEFIRTVGSPNRHKGAQIAIYSSGSVESQKLLFTHTTDGDLTPYISAYLDPSMVGSKVMPSSYDKVRSRLAKEYRVSPDTLRIIFVTDNPSEASAAETSGAVDASVVCIRPLNDPVTIDSLMAIRVGHICSFHQLLDPSEPVALEGMVAAVQRYQ